MKLVMVLGGGGAKAAAHVGAARALREAGIMPVQWIGTSMGGTVAAALASGIDLDLLFERISKIRRNDVVRTNWAALAGGLLGRSVLRSAPLRRMIESLVPARSFGELTTACTVTATDVRTGAEVVFGHGGEEAPLVDVLLATCALPPYFAPVSVNGRSCFDGGVRRVVPLPDTLTVECDRVVAIDTGPGFDHTGENAESPPPLLAATDAAINWLMASVTELQRAQWPLVPGRPPLIWLRPVTDRGAMFAADRAVRYADAGYRAMRAALEDW